MAKSIFVKIILKTNDLPDNHNQLDNITYSEVLKSNGKHVIFGVIECFEQSDECPYWYVRRLYYPTIIKRDPIQDTKDIEILTEVLKKMQDNYVSQYAAKNIHCPPEVLAEVLRRGKDDYVSWEAARNPNCPPEILAEILKTGRNDFVSGHAASNLNCPPEALTEVLKRCNNNWVSQHAAKNPNCPPKAKIEWLEATRQLIKYDPETFELEHVEQDKDLEELRKLL